MKNGAKIIFESRKPILQFLQFLSFSFVKIREAMINTDEQVRENTVQRRLTVSLEKNRKEIDVVREDY